MPQQCASSDCVRRFTVSEDRLTGLDASFLHMERAGAHMHVASTIIFEGSAPEPRRVPRPHRLAPAPGAALPPEAALRPLRPGPPGLGRRPLPQPRLPRAPDRAAGARLRGAAAQPGGADLLPAARPHQAALGAVAGRGPRRRPLRDRRQEPPRAGRRRLRGRHHHRPLRHSSPSRTNPPARPPKWAPRPEPTDLDLLARAPCASAPPARGRSSAASAPPCAARARCCAGSAPPGRCSSAGIDGAADALQRRDRPAPAPRLRPQPTSPT